MVLLALCFGLVFLVDRVVIFLGFFAPLAMLVPIALFAFALLKWATGRVAGSKEPAPRPGPHFGSPDA